MLPSSGVHQVVSGVAVLLGMEQEVAGGIAEAKQAVLVADKAAAGAARTM